MGKDLKTLIRLRRFEVDEVRRHLADLNTRQDALAAEARALEAELVREETFARNNPAMGQTLGAYVTRFLHRRQQLAERRQQLDALVAQAQDVLAEGFKELKTLELTQENRDKREQERLDRREQSVLDEIGLTLHRRRGQGQSGE